MKKINIVSLITLCAIVAVSTVYARQNISEMIETPAATELTELNNALNNSGALRSRYNIIFENETPEQIQAKNNANMMNNESSTNANSAIKLYKASISDDSTSIAEQLDKENEMWLIPKVIDGKISYVYMEKGEDVDIIAERIKDNNCSEKDKEEMLQLAKEREGKWYVSRISTPCKQDDANDFVNINNINTMLESSNVADIQDMKYVYFTNNNTLGIWVKTNSTEYIIPYNAHTKIGEMLSNNLYTLSYVVDNTILKY